MTVEASRMICFFQGFDTFLESAARPRLDCLRRFDGPTRQRSMNRRRQQIEVDHRMIGQGHQPLNLVLQFAYIARPIMGLEAGQHFVG